MPQFEVHTRLELTMNIVGDILVALLQHEKYAEDPYIGVKAVNIALSVLRSVEQHPMLQIGKHDHDRAVN